MNLLSKCRPLSLFRRCEALVPIRTQVSSISRSFPSALLLFMAATLVMAVASACYTLFFAYYLRLPYPYGLPWFGGLEPYRDFTDFADRYAHFGTTAFWHQEYPQLNASYQKEYPLIYPAALLTIIALLYKLPFPLISYLVIFTAALMTLGLFLAQGLIKQGCSVILSISLSLVLIVTCWPAAFVVSRANLEGVNFIFLSLGLVLVMHQRLYAGAIAIALAGSLKYYPVLPILALLSLRAYKPLLLGVLVAGVTSVICLAYVDPAFAEFLGNSKLSVSFMGNLYFSQMQFPEYDHSLFMLYKTGYRWTKHWGDPSFVGSFSSLPYLICAAALGVAVYFGRLRNLPVLNQLIGLTVCSVLLPPISYDYTLVSLLAPCALLCIYAATAWRLGQTIRGLTPALMCFSLIFTWGTFLTFAHTRFAGQVRTIALLALLSVLLIYPFRRLEVSDNLATVRA